MKQLCYISILITILIVNTAFQYLRKKGEKQPGTDSKRYRILSYYLQVISDIILFTLLICFFFLFDKK